MISDSLFDLIDSQTTPKKTPETPTLLDFSTPIGSLSSPPLRHRSDSFAEKSSSIVESPKSFSVNSLEYDGHDDNEVSPRWYQTVEQGISTFHIFVQTNFDLFDLPSPWP